jgi:IS605 OrfB family transposase
LSALLDVRSAVNRLVNDWRDHPDESRFDATKRSYRELRPRYPHLAATWAVVMCNETSASLASWDRHLRRWKRHEPRKWERLRNSPPHRRRLKASLHPALYRLRHGVLDITISPNRHVRIDLSAVKNPLFSRYLAASKGSFGLAVTGRSLLFNFHVPHEQPVVARSAGIDVNMPSADLATSDGRVDSVDLVPITRIQGAMQRKRESVQERIPQDLRLQRKVLGRLKAREKHRVEPLLHRAANELLKKVGDRNVVLEDLRATQEELMRTTRSADARRKLSRWTQGRLQRIVQYSYVGSAPPSAMTIR